MRGDEDPRFEEYPVTVVEGAVALLREAAVRTTGRRGWWRGGCAFEGGLHQAREAAKARGEGGTRKAKRRTGTTVRRDGREPTGFAAVLQGS